MSDAIQPGDVVEEKEGDGRRMVVETVEAGVAVCVWPHDGAVMRGRFPVAALVLSE